MSSGTDRLTCFLFFLALAGCSGSGGEPMQIPYERSQQIISDWIALLDSEWQSSSPEEAFRRAEQYLKAQPEVAEVHADYQPLDASFEFRLKDGVGVDLFDLPEGTEDLLGPPSGGAPAPVPRAELKPGIVDPTLAHFWECTLDHASHAEQYRQMAQRAGFRGAELLRATDPGACTVDSFMLLDAFSLLFLQIHGGYSASLGLGSLLTAEERSPEHDDLYRRRDEFAQDRVRLAALSTHKVYYTVTARFLDHYLEEFPEYSLVVMNSCHSAEGSGAGHSIADTLRAKKAGAVLGWNRAVRVGVATAAADYLFDTLFGENGYVQRTPPARPFGIAAAYHQGLVVRNLHQDIQRQSSMVLVPPLQELAFHDVLVRPLLLKIGTDWETQEAMLGAKNRLLLQGQFGSRQGRACVAESCSPLLDAGMGTLFAAADVAPAASGEAKVLIDEAPSNGVPLGEWSGTLSFEGEGSDEQGPHVKGTMQFRFRADILPQRASPEEAPDPATADAVTSFQEDSRCRATVSGTYSVGSYDRWTYVYQGEHEVTAAREADGDSAYSGAVRLEPASGQASFTVVCEIPYRLTITDNQTGEVTVQDGLQIIHGTPTAALSPRGVISAGEVRLSSNYRYPDMFLTSWEQITPLSGPTDATAR